MSVLIYISRRLLQSIPVLIAVTLIAFSLIHLIPGDPVRVMLGTRATEESVAALREQLGLDEALPTQYIKFILNAARFEFGDSLFLRAAIGPIIVDRGLNSVSLLLYSMLVSLVIAVPLAIVAAVRRNRPADHLVRLFTTITFAMPAFWTALLLVLVFSLRLKLFPTSGLGQGFGPFVVSLTLPAVTIGFYLAPVLLRSLRASLIETLAAEFIEAARARGLSESRVLLKHVLRNSLIAMITVLGVNIGFLISGAVVVENVSSIPGLGSLMVTSIVSRDYPVIVALTSVFGVAVVFVNLLVDLSYAILDPRIRL
ncbi:MAG: ABC transporter permease [Chloroflexi bacterium]|nr:ABC transporter permease [Chloroflexota bacterium]